MNSVQAGESRLATVSDPHDSGRLLREIAMRPPDREELPA